MNENLTNLLSTRACNIDSLNANGEKRKVSHVSYEVLIHNTHSLLIQIPQKKWGISKEQSCQKGPNWS